MVTQVINTLMLVPCGTVSNQVQIHNYTGMSAIGILHQISPLSSVLDFFFFFFCETERTRDTSALSCPLFCKQKQPFMKLIQ